jgi:two-component system, NtrC family, response regulator HydG
MDQGKPDPTEPRAHVLIVERDARQAQTLRAAVERLGFEVAVVQDAAACLAHLRESMPLAVLCEARLPDRDGLTLLEDAAGWIEDCPFVMMSSGASVEMALDAVGHGALDFLPKPVSARRLETILERVRLQHERRTEAERLRRELGVSGERDLVAASPAMRAVVSLARRVAGTRSAVLLTGESGTGKEKVAFFIHSLGGADAPFVAVNCAAVPGTLLESEFFGHERGAFTGADRRRAGCFEAASGGTLFLDEIGEMPTDLQPKLLRALDHGEVTPLGSQRPVSVDVRMIAATHRDLGKDVQEGRFREDLFWRLNVVAIHVPPLRERREDIPLLAQRFVDGFAARDGRRVRGFDRGVRDWLMAYDWPGNVRELKNVVERAVLLARGRWITREQIPPNLLQRRRHGHLALELDLRLAEVERRYVIEVLRLHGGSRERTAAALGITRRTLFTKLKSYGVT